MSVGFTSHKSQRYLGGASPNCGAAGALHMASSGGSGSATGGDANVLGHLRSVPPLMPYQVANAPIGTNEFLAVIMLDMR